MRVVRVETYGWKRERNRSCSILSPVSDSSMVGTGMGPPRFERGSGCSNRELVQMGQRRIHKPCHAGKGLPCMQSYDRPCLSLQGVQQRTLKVAQVKNLAGEPSLSIAGLCSK